MLPKKLKHPGWSDRQSGFHLQFRRATELLCLQRYQGCDPANDAQHGHGSGCGQYPRNCVCPGLILTEATERYAKERNLTIDQVDAEEGAKTLLKRAGRPLEVAQAVRFLASDEASYITGTFLMVDGGFTANNARPI